MDKKIKLTPESINQLPLNFDEAYAELQLILEKLENDDLVMDQLPLLLDRAKVLNQYCENWLTGLDQKTKEQ
jgi:exodeoxyribonuclease VII small subunit